ncbi:hypothetical protein N752_29040 [Desulforamulus aquiferis]|nr:hypothetical protein [Desulforamulus aquiferis]RYD01625.1 hypothetical protein N752_29040 [Desulforamulus aquiferis]
MPVGNGIEHLMLALERLARLELVSVGKLQMLLDFESQTIPLEQAICASVIVQLSCPGCYDIPYEYKVE